MQLPTTNILEQLLFLKKGRELLLLEFVKPSSDILKNVYLYESDPAVQQILLSYLKNVWLSKWLETSIDNLQFLNIEAGLVSRIVTVFSEFQSDVSFDLARSMISAQKDGLEFILNASTVSRDRIDEIRAALYKQRAKLKRKIQASGGDYGDN
ncbi:MAG: hypothetical protein ACP59X_05005 [Solidesulfovibrio sp. DCME]|uniref:hypothetical protein n=1 Tax=Solidesulfovibrio sp. DCME TaxID=3447380 RepID=UPI003D0F2172